MHIIKLYFCVTMIIIISNNDVDYEIRNWEEKKWWEECDDKHFFIHWMEEEISHTHYEYKLWFLSFADVLRHIFFPASSSHHTQKKTYRMAKAISSKTLNRNSLSSMYVRDADMYAWFLLLNIHLNVDYRDGEWG
jgi:hypothetical protein